MRRILFLTRVYISVSILKGARVDNTYLCVSILYEANLESIQTDT